MDLCSNRITAQGRRDMLRALSCGFGFLAFAGIAQRAAAAAPGLWMPSDDVADPLSPKAPMLPAKAN